MINKVYYRKVMFLQVFVCPRGIWYLWSHVPSREGRVSLVPCPFWEVGYIRRRTTPRRTAPQGLPPRSPPTHTHTQKDYPNNASHTQKDPPPEGQLDTASGRYTSYSNAFLFLMECDCNVTKRNRCLRTHDCSKDKDAN